MILWLLLVDSFPLSPSMYLCSFPLHPGPWEADLGGFQLGSDQPEHQQESGRREERSQCLCSPTSIPLGCHGTHVWRSQLLPDGSPCLSPDAGNCFLLVSLQLPKLLEKIPSLNSFQINQLCVPPFPARSLATPEIIREVIFSPVVVSCLHIFVSHLVVSSEKTGQTQPACPVSPLTCLSLHPADFRRPLSVLNHHCGPTLSSKSLSDSGI